MMMTRSSFLLGVTATLFLAGRVRAGADDMAEVERAARRFGELRSYAFRLSYAADGIPLMRTRYVVDGEWERGIAHMVIEGRNGPVELYVRDERSVVRTPGGQWHVGEGDDRGRGERRGGARSGSRMGLPSEDLDEVHTKFTSVRRSERAEVIDSRVCEAYVGNLTTQAVRGLTESLGLPIRDPGPRATATIWIDGEGVIRKYGLEGTPKVVALGLTFNVTVHKTAEIGDVNSAVVSPPAAVMTLLEHGR